MSFSRNWHGQSTRNRSKWGRKIINRRRYHIETDTTRKQKTIRSHKKYISVDDCRDVTKINRQRKMWRLWRKSSEGQPVLESSEKERYCSLPKKRTCEDGLRKKVSWRSKSSRKGKGERRSSLNGQTRAESRALRLLSAVGSMGVPVARVSITTANAGLKSKHWKCGRRPERIGQWRSCYQHGEDPDSGPRWTSREAVKVRRSL